MLATKLSVTIIILNKLEALVSGCECGKEDLKGTYLFFNCNTVNIIAEELSKIY